MTESEKAHRYSMIAVAVDKKKKADADRAWLIRQNEIENRREAELLLMETARWSK